MTLAHWDDVEREVRDVGDMRATFRALGEAAGASAVGVSRIDVEPGCRAGPVHQHGSEEEIFFVLAGSGLAWIDGAVHEIGPGDTLVYLAGGPLHTVIAGDDGLSVLAYGENHAPPLVRLPRAGMVRRGGIWLEASRDDPLEREAAAGPLELPEPTPRPPCSVALEDVEVETDEVGEFDITERDVGPCRRARCARACATTSSRRASSTARRTGTPPSTSSSSSSTAAATLAALRQPGRARRGARAAPRPLRRAPGRHAPAPTRCAPASTA